MHGSAGVLMQAQPRYERAVPPSFSAVTRISSQALPARSLQLAKVELAIVDQSDQVQECASEEADSNLTTTLNFSVFQVTNFPVFCGCSCALKPLESSKGATELSKGYQAACQQQGHYGLTCSQELHVPKGMWVDVQACVMNHMQVFPSAEGAVAAH